jgi:cytochrome c biogenesis protein
MSVIKSKPGEGVTPPHNSIIDGVFQFLSSVRFAILALSFIALSCVIGTLILQQAPSQEYLKQFSESSYAILKFFGFTDVFHAPWFIFLLGLFVLNLVFCTVTRLGRFLKSRKEIRIPGQKALTTMENSLLVPDKKVDEVAGLLKGYRKAAADESGLVLDKGGLSRYGVYLIHGSIILILIGSLVGLMFGYRGFVNLSKGEAKDRIVERGERGKEIPLGFKIQCDDFKVAFYPTGEPKDYVSRLRIISNGKSVREAEVRVNHPLTYKGTSIYQASYGSNPAFLFDIGGDQVKLAQGGVYKKGSITLMVVRFERSVHDFGPGVQVAYLDGNEPKTTWFLKDVPNQRERQIMGSSVKLSEINDDFYTGIEVSRDPGVWIVWVGFAMILFGLYVNFFMHYRRIFLLQTTEGVLVAGMAFRNKEAFKEEFQKIRRRLNDHR